MLFSPASVSALATLALAGLTSALPATSPRSLGPRSSSDTCSATSYTLFKIPYANDALAPYISEATNVAHLALAQRSVDSLNAAAASLLVELTTDHLDLTKLNTLARTLLTATGSLQTHYIYFNALAPVSSGGGDTSKASAVLTAQVLNDFGSWELLLASLDAGSLSVTASGWSWLCYDTKNKSLATVTTPDRELLGPTLIPLLDVDVFEHAYFLDRAQDKGAYLKALRSIYNWEFASERFDEILAAQHK